MNASDSDLREVLRKSWMFAEFSDAELERIVALACTREFDAKQEIVRKGEAGDGLYVLMQGCVQVVSTSDTGGLTAFRVLKPGEVFGEIALLDGYPRSATVTTMEPCTTAFIPQSAFQQLLLEHPRLALVLLSLLSRRIRALSERIEDRASLAIKARLAKQIVHLADEHGAPMIGGGVRISLSLSQQELGRFVDATRESVNKHMRTWTRTGVLRHDRDKLDVYDIDALRSMWN